MKTFRLFAGSALIGGIVAETKGVDLVLTALLCVLWALLLSAITQEPQP